MKLLKTILSGLCLMAAALQAQTVKPVISELGNPAKGRIEYYNDSLTPLNVVLEPKSFTVSETGEISYRPLDYHDPFEVVHHELSHSAAAVVLRFLRSRYAGGPRHGL